MRLLGRIASGTDFSGELLVLPSFVCFEPSAHSAQRRVCTVKNGFISKCLFYGEFSNILSNLFIIFCTSLSRLRTVWSLIFLAFWSIQRSRFKRSDDSLTCNIHEIFSIEHPLIPHYKERTTTTEAAVTNTIRGLFDPQGTNIHDNNINEIIKQHLFDPTHLQVVSALHRFHVLLAPPLSSSHFHLRACVNNQ